MAATSDTESDDFRTKTRRSRHAAHAGDRLRGRARTQILRNSIPPSPCTHGIRTSPDPPPPTVRCMQQKSMSEFSTECWKICDVFHAG